MEVAKQHWTQDFLQENATSVFSNVDIEPLISAVWARAPNRYLAYDLDNQISVYWSESHIHTK